MGVSKQFYHHFVDSKIPSQAHCTRILPGVLAKTEVCIV